MDDSTAVEYDSGVLKGAVLAANSFEGVHRALPFVNQVEIELRVQPTVISDVLYGIVDPGLAFAEHYVPKRFAIFAEVALLDWCDLLGGVD